MIGKYHIQISSLCMSVLLSGCATMTRGTSQDFQIITDPPGATVVTSLEHADSRKARALDPSLPASNFGCAPTPCGFDVPRKASFIAQVNKDGYASVPIIVRPKSDLTGVSTSAIGTAPAVGISAVNASAALGGVGLGGTTFLASSYASIFAAPAILVDSSNGSMLSLYPNPVEITLTPQAEAAPQSGGRIISDTGVVEP